MRGRRGERHIIFFREPIRNRLPSLSVCRLAALNARARQFCDSQLQPIVPAIMPPSASGRLPQLLLSGPYRFAAMEAGRTTASLRITNALNQLARRAELVDLLCLPANRPGIRRIDTASSWRHNFQIQTQSHQHRRCFAPTAVKPSRAMSAPTRRGTWSRCFDSPRAPQSSRQSRRRNLMCLSRSLSSRYEGATHDKTKASERERFRVD